jgi:RNA polymerase sigma-70 factor (ECF subfamily)
MTEKREQEKPVQMAAAQAIPDNPAADLERVFRDHQQRVLRAAYRITGSVEDSQDVLQTVFMRLVRREGGSPPLSDSPASYLHRAAVNAALDVVRSRHAARSTSLEDVEPMIADEPERGPGRRQDASEIRDQIRGALSRMSAKAAEVFALRYFEGYGNHEIAKMLGTSRSTINVILHRTRQKLREAIGPYVGEES